MQFKRRWEKISALVLFYVWATATPARADSVNLLANGSFETPLAGSVCGAYSSCLGFHNAVAGNDNIGGWQLIGKSGIDSNGDPIPGAPASILLLGFNYTEPDNASGQTLYFHPQDGQQSLDLTGEGNQGPNGIKQIVSTTPGVSYILTFWLGHQYSSAPGYQSGPAATALYIDGSLADLFSNSADTAEDVTWIPFSYSFEAASSETVIAFLNNSDANNFAGLDNVSLVAASNDGGPHGATVPVPEPPSALHLGLGLTLLAGLMRRLG